MANLVTDGTGTVKFHLGTTTIPVTRFFTEEMKWEAPDGTVPGDGVVRIDLPPPGRPDNSTKSSTDGTTQDTSEYIDHIDTSDNSQTLTSGSIEAEDTLSENALFETIVPFERNADGAVVVGADQAIAVRLRNIDGIDLTSLWAQLVPEQAANAAQIQWQLVQSDSNDDLWILFTPTEFWSVEKIMSLIAGGLTVAREPIETEVYTVTLDATRDMNIAETATRVTEIDSASIAPIDQFGNGVVYIVEPQQVYSEPRVIRIPMTDFNDSGNAELYYYLSHGDNQGWHPADQIVGFLADVEPVEVAVEGITYVEYQVNHSGIVQLYSGLEE